ncbi:MAG: DISARM system phospholipase D-like protein DrmC [Zavarzinella sp.]|nr:DISARM system phospholipase D-like protein DrmC [Zavarzinella sp.]
MADPLHELTDAALGSMAAALREGRLAAPYAALGQGHNVGRELVRPVADRLAALDRLGMRPEHVAVMLDAILDARVGRPPLDDAIELVWTGPETEAVVNRDTAVVVRELFGQATESVLVAGFAVYQGREVFRKLADRMAELPGLRVRLYLDVHRGHQDTALDSELVRRFARKFVKHDWPNGTPLPEVYYDPRSLSPDPTGQSSLHAKCVVVDRRIAFVTSANFTQAAHERNIEVGVMVRSPRFAGRLADQFESLTEAGRLRRLSVGSFEH